MSDIAQTGSGEWTQGLPIVLASLIGIMLCLSPQFNWAFNISGEELDKEFGWNHRAITAGFNRRCAIANPNSSFLIYGINNKASSVFPIVQIVNQFQWHC